MAKKTKKAVRDHLSQLVKDAMTRVSNFDETDGGHNPFRSRLIDDAYLEAAKFERSFVTSMGSRGYEQLGRIIAEGAGHTATRSRITQGPISAGQRAYIATLLRSFRVDKKAVPDWMQEVAKLAELASDGARETVSITSDLYVKTTGGEELFFSMKTVKPNLDQTERAKRDLLELIAMNPDHKAYFVLPYNPYGEEREKYNFTIPFKIFDMRKDPSVLIGKDFWDLLGGPGTYEDLLEVFGEVGEELQERLAEFFEK